MVTKQVVTIIVLAAILGLGINLFSPHKISYVGQYRPIIAGSGPIIPPEAVSEDPQFIGVDVAELAFKQKSTIFIDARELEEFECGTIPGSINIPFDYLPDDDLGKYFDSALGGNAKDHPIITFCSGSECDLSLHLARNLQAFGYTKVSIFFGGAREWEKTGMAMERRGECGE